MRALAAMTALALLLAGCGGDDDDGTAIDEPSAEESPDGMTDGGATTDEGESFALELTGLSEVPGPGDEEGSGTAEITLGEGEACADVEVTLGSPPQAMHIHEGTAEGAGPIVIDFGPVTQDDGWSICVVADQADLDDISADSSNYYLNVHNADFPDGAVRAQLG
ncbi:MAG: CHRD domain-containing protein [Acidimicrobiales bacterium]